ncbi:hypothetical protein OE88DRAFT_1737014 [Heliocybe sulcata]|uniref:MYND-type domain-containing protein n=1 Tax=Heliocybe sulcata TaxID=5364 RepID=A0A5C3MX03_9AGAM|nr:hypothetical protein OE88DRAFT_1737014 [Heliocybe sulcata]
MPGPGKTKSKAKAKSTRPRPPAQSAPIMQREAFVDDIDQSEGWDMTVHILCDYFRLPDLTTRSGLKRVHADFESIYRRLDNAYDNYGDNERVLGGIVGIYAKMCTDSILRDKLFKAGFLSKLIPLLYNDTCRQMALRALSTVTHHGGLETRIEIAKKTPALLEILQEHNNDPKVAELCVVIMCHAIGAVIDVEEVPDPKVVKTIDFPQVLRTVVAEVKKATASYYLISHAVGLLGGGTHRCRKDYEAFEPALTFLVAALRSKDIHIRSESLGGLLRYHRDVAEDDQTHNDGRKLVACLQRGYPSQLNDVLMRYGPTRCDAYLTVYSYNDHTKAIMQNAQDHDFYKLGKVVGRLITTTEFCMAEGFFQADSDDVDTVTGMPAAMDVGLPYVFWSDALPYCTKALRDKGDLDLADIIELKYLIMKQRHPECFELAKEAIKRNPQAAYYYYAVTTATTDLSVGLRYAKKGLKAKQTTPFVRFALLHRAVDHAGTLGLNVLTSAAGYHAATKWEEGVAFLTSAREDAKTFIEGAPPDSRHMKNMLNWYIILTILLQGPDMSPELRELDDMLRKVELAEEFSRFYGYPVPDTLTRLTRQTVLSLYTVAVAEWSSIIRRFDEEIDGHDPSELSKERREDDLAAWLDDVHLHEHQSHAESCSHPRVNVNDVSLYRCSWCGNPSAVLRKCSGCSKTRYCDAGCQKSHWSTHKSLCKNG